MWWSSLSSLTALNHHHHHHRRSHRRRHSASSSSIAPWTTTVSAIYVRFIQLMDFSSCYIIFGTKNSNKNTSTHPNCAIFQDFYYIIMYRCTNYEHHIVFLFDNWLIGQKNGQLIHSLLMKSTPDTTMHMCVCYCCAGSMQRNSNRKAMIMASQIHCIDELVRINMIRNKCKCVCVCFCVWVKQVRNMIFTSIKRTSFATTIRRCIDLPISSIVPCSNGVWRASGSFQRYNNW